MALMLGLVTLLIFLPVTRFDFVDYDDNAYITENNIVQNGLTLSGFNWAFTTGYAENWFPVTWLSHMADCALFQLYAGGHHATNALLHSVNSGLLFLLLLRLTGKQWPSLIVAAFFAWHPVHVESVAWVAERKDVLSTFFALLALLNYTRFVREKSRPHYWLALGCFALGLMSKPMLVTLPFVLLLLDFWPLQRFSLSAFPGRLVLEKVPFFVLTLASCAVTLVVQRPAMASSDVMPFPFRLANALVACGRYLLKLAWPADLAIFYPLAQISSWPLAASVLVLAAISIAVWLARRLVLVSGHPRAGQRVGICRQCRPGGPLHLYPLHWSLYRRGFRRVSIFGKPAPAAAGLHVWRDSAAHYLRAPDGTSIDVLARFRNPVPACAGRDRE